MPPEKVAGGVMKKIPEQIKIATVLIAILPLFLPFSPGGI